QRSAAALREPAARRVYDVQQAAMTLHPTGPAAIESYVDVLTYLTSGGNGGRSELPFIRNVRGVESLFRTMSAVGAATPGASDEEWNPLSQRPHSPAPPRPSHALGVE